MNREEIILINTILTKELPLSNNVLLRYGFTEERIEELIKEGILEPTSYKKYKLSKINNLYQQGVKFLLEKDYTIADKCFEICQKIEPENRDVCIQIFLKYIKKRKYQEAYDLFDHILTIEPTKNKIYNNIYLYLVSFLPSCPKKYLDRVRNINEDDLILPSDNNDKFKNRINTISENIQQSKYTQAIHLINDIIADESKYNVKYQLLKELLLQVSDIEKEYKSKLTYLAEEEAYQTIINRLSEREKERKLTNREKQMMFICETIIDIIDNKNIPIPSIEKTDNLNDAIIGNNFNLAMNLIKKEPKTKENHPISILLIKANEIIDIIKQEEIIDQILEDKSTSEIIYEPTETYQQDKLFSFVATSELFDDLFKDDHIPTKKELGEHIRVIDITKDHEISDAKDFANYLKENDIPLDVAVKKYGIIGEQILLIKLIYAQYHYQEGQIELADKLIHEVEISLHMTNKIAKLLNEIKSKRPNEIQKTSHTKKRRKKRKCN